MLSNIKLNLSPINFSAQAKHIQQQTPSFYGFQPLTKDTVCFSGYGKEEKQTEKLMLAKKYNFKHPEKFTENEKKLIKLGLLPSNPEVCPEGQRLTLEEIREIYPALASNISNILQSEEYHRSLKLTATLNGIEPSEMTGWTKQDYNNLREKLSEKEQIKEYDNHKDYYQIRKNLAAMTRKEFESALTSKDPLKQIIKFKYDPAFNDIEKHTIDYCMPTAAENEASTLKAKASREKRLESKARAQAAAAERLKLWQERTGLENPTQASENKWQLGLPQSIPDEHVNLEINRRELLIDAKVLGLEGFDPALSIDKDPQLENYKKLKQAVNNKRNEIAYNVTLRKKGEAAAKEFLAEMQKSPDFFTIPYHDIVSLLEAEWIGIKTEEVPDYFWVSMRKQVQIREFEEESIRPYYSDNQVTPDDFEKKLKLWTI